MRVTVCDVGPRDGLQNEPETLEPAVRAELVERLARAGLPRIEAVSFVHPDRVPQMAGAEDVVSAVKSRDGAELAGLVLNEKGYERLAETDLDRVNVTLAATDSFSERNAGMPRGEALRRARAIVRAAAADGRPSTATVSVAFGCPFEGKVEPDRVVEIAAELTQADELVLADTIGVATPTQVKRLVGRVAGLGKPVGAHLHNTRNTGFANAYAAVEGGAQILDASVGGLGGCPFAPRATGNVATEDVVYALEREGIETGVDLEALIDVAGWMAGVLGRDLPGRVYRAGAFPAA
jgi:hydroxymethylglutaryl-CoA lyase/(R)-citramalyl-CoA lyase